MSVELRSAIQLFLAPGTYSVTWFVPLPDGSSKEARGEIELASDEKPTGFVNLDEIAAVLVPSGLGTEIRRWDLLRGMTDNGIQLILINPTVIGLFGESRLSAPMCLVGLRPTEIETIEVNGFRLQIEGLDEINSYPPLSKISFPNPWLSGNRYLEGTFSAEGNPASSHEWSSSDSKMKLSYTYFQPAVLHHAYNLNFSPVLRVDLYATWNVRDVLSQWIEPLRRVLTLSTSRQERLTALFLRLDTGLETGQEFQVYGTEVYQEPYLSDGRKLERRSPAFTVSNKGISLLEVLERWQALDKQQHPLLETYAAMLYTKEQHPRSRFLLLLQAIEGLHANESFADINARAQKHQEKRSALLNKLEKFLDDDDSKFFDTWLITNPRPQLSAAISNTIQKMPNPKDVTNALTGTRLITSNVAGATDLDALRIVRNDLSHGKRSHDFEDLLQVVQILDGIVQTMLARLLDLPKEVCAALQDRGLKRAGYKRPAPLPAVGQPTGPHSIKWIIERGFSGPKLLKSIQRDVVLNPQVTDDVEGVYVILRPGQKPISIVDHRHSSPGPNEKTVQEVEAKWVPDVNVVYIGKAPVRTRGKGLVNRLQELNKYGYQNGQNHHGGRLIWRLKDREQLLVAWKVLPVGSAGSEEYRLIEEFLALHGKLPFANLKRGDKPKDF